MLRKLLTEELTSERLSLKDIHLSLITIQQKLEEELAGKQKIIDNNWEEINRTGLIHIFLKAFPCL